MTGEKKHEDILNFMQLIAFTITIIFCMYGTSYYFDNMKFFDIGLLIFCIIHTIIFGLLLIINFRLRHIVKFEYPEMYPWLKRYVIMDGIWLILLFISMVGIREYPLETLMGMLFFQSLIWMLSIFYRVRGK